jgi:hypothetical protein
MFPHLLPPVKIIANLISEALIFPVFPKIKHYKIRGQTNFPKLWKNKCLFLNIQIVKQMASHQRFSSLFIKKQN